MQEKSKKRKVITQVIIAVVVVAILAISANLIQYYFFKGPSAVDKHMTELVTKYNKNCPLTIQEGIRLDSVSLIQEKVAQYNLTLVNNDKETTDVGALSKNIEESLLSTAKANPGLKDFRDNNFTLIYSYNDKKNEFLFKIKIIPEQYK
ncbi:hypothetical protein OIU83_16825 [Flavobacterium sp. LS1R49]|uniref:Uncharacterized protein n=1 Tax=Flavobacterium shii TaxID=2987687 RepID=A0A9X2ZKG5_9FLAO|nr:hypothetical protein [Flavobacterium shii]MCV9929333.1 hypothetical protein [Flavobacterium shii]